MLSGYRLFDADAHVLVSPKMWQSLPKEFAQRRPRPVKFGDAADLGDWTTSWLCDGRIEPPPFGPGTHAANTPHVIMEEYGANPQRAGRFTSFPVSIGALDLSDPAARLNAMDQMGIDIQMLFPSTIYASMSTDPGLEAALFRAYNRYVAAQCRHAPKRLKWAGLLPLRDTRLALEALEEMQTLGAKAAIVFGTAGERMLSDASLTPVWDVFARCGLPLCVHMAMSYPPFRDLCHTIQDSNMIGKAIPGQLAFVAIVGHGMLDKYPDLRVAFLEFGGEWIFYSVGRMSHYAKLNRGRMLNPGVLPKKTVEDYVKSQRIFLGPELSDAMLPLECDLLGDGQILYSSDFPHGEGRESAAQEIIDRNDLGEDRKRKILYDNAARFYGEA